MAERGILKQSVDGKSSRAIPAFREKAVWCEAFSEASGENRSGAACLKIAVRRAGCLTLSGRGLIELKVKIQGGTVHAMHPCSANGRSVC